MTQVEETFIFNTLSRKKEKLTPAHAGELRFYSCGPTVYNLIHIGNLRTAMVADMFVRYWKKSGYKVLYARNYTDVDDKIIKRAAEEACSISDLAEQYIKEVEKDYKRAGLLEPTYKPKVTETLDEITQLILDIVHAGHAYRVEGNVIFSVKSFQAYGDLSGKPLEKLMAGARVDVDKEKKDPLDFYLWKQSSKDEIGWESPWGKGRPGWHIECSAMIRKYLGDQIDVHHGGVDLIFPHHENEIAQSECGGSQHPFARYWVHNAFLTIKKEKMSKSIGNVFLAREFLDQFSGEMARYLMLTPHYRSPIDFSENSLWTAAKALERIYETKKLAQECIQGAKASSKPSASFQDLVTKTRSQMKAAYADDMHTPGVVAHFFDLIREYNKIAQQGSNEERRANAELFIECLQSEVVEVLGFGSESPETSLEGLSRIQKKIKGIDSSPQERLPAEKIETLIKEREQSRRQKDFQRADEIRNELASQGVELKDTAQGTKWVYR